MAVSILHRITGSALSIMGLAVLTWWLIAIASGPDAYASFSTFAGWLIGNEVRHAAGVVGWIRAIVGLLVGVGLIWSFFQHLLSGIRHLVMDTGAGFELSTNKRFAVLTMLGSALLTAFFWAYLFGVRP